MRDKNINVRLNAIKAIETIAPKIPETIKKATPYLVARLNDSDIGVRKATFSCLDKIGIIKPKIVVPFLVKQLKHKNPEVRISSSIILKNIAKNYIHEIKIAIPILFELLKDSDQRVRNRANEALIEIGIRKPKFVVPLFIERLEDKEREVLWWITALSSIKALGKIAEKRQKETKDAVPSLARCLIKDIWELRENAALTLGKIGKNRLGYVIEAIPNLVNCLKDSDDLVRTTTAHALDKIGVKPEEYRLIQKASNSLSTAQFVVTSIKNFGIGVRNVEKTLNQAKKAFDNNDYEEAIELGVAAEEEARKQEEFYLTAEENIKTSASFIEEIESYGIDVREAKNLLINAKNVIKNEEYNKAVDFSIKAKRLAKECKENAKPELTINVTAHDDFKIGEWSRIATTIQNNGGAHASNIEVDFFGSIEAQGSKRIPQLKIGEKAELILDLSPKIDGKIPLEINISYQDFEERGYQIADKSLIETINENEIQSSKKKTIFSIRTHSPTKNYFCVQKISDMKGKEIACPKCNAKMPNNFRICGKCGAVLTKICQSCGNKVPINFKFCGGCGSKIGNSCPKCNLENPENYMFCGGCGGKLK